MTKGRIIVLACLFLLAAAAVAWLNKQQATLEKKAAQELPRPSATPTPATHFPRFEMPNQPRYDTSSVSGSFPPDIPSYKNPGMANPLPEAVRLAGLFGISGTPNKIEKPRGVYYSWSGGAASFSVGADPLEVYYRASLPANPPLIQASEGVFVGLAKRFIQTSGLLPPDASLSEPRVVYLSPHGTDPIQTTRDKATIIKLECWALLGNYPLLSGYPEIPSFALWYDANQRLVSFSGVYYPRLTREGAPTALASVDEARRRLVSGGGSLLSVFSQADVNRVETYYYDFSVTKIASVSLAYYYAPGQTALVPVYVFYGEATDRKTKKPVQTITLVSALP